MEALIVHYIDDLDSKVNSILGIIAADSNQGELTAPNKMHERPFIKPKHKPSFRGPSPGIE